MINGRTHTGKNDHWPHTQEKMINGRTHTGKRNGTDNTFLESKLMLLQIS